MKDQTNTKQKLIQELDSLRRRVAELEQSQSEHKRAEEALRESEEKYRTIVENTNDAIYIIDFEGNIIDVNENACRMVEYMRDELVGAHLSKIDKAWHNPENKELGQLIRKGGIVFERETVRKDGSVVPIEVSVKVISHEGRCIILGFVRDITDRKRAERELQRSNDLLRAIIEAAPTAIIGLDLDGNVHTVWNQSAEKMLGWSAQEVMGRPLPSVQTESQEEFRRFRERIRSGMTLDGVEVRRQRKDGTPIDYSIYASPLHDPEGRIVGNIAVLVDITDHKRAEEEKSKLEHQTRQLQKAESLGRMAGAIAHHFNNQLSAVMGNLDMALEKLTQGAKPIKNLSAAMQAADKAAKVSGLMLTYLGQTPCKREPLDLSETCHRSLPMLRAVMPGKVVLETDLPSPGPAIRANANQIQQVLTNLITNAWEAVGDDGGSIHIGVKTVSLTDTPPLHHFPIGWQPQGNDYACLEVTDTGCGIADKDIEKLFDPFFSSKFTGRGLGLAVVMGIVRANGGAVTVESEPGIGSAFRVFFPVTVEEVPRQPDKEAQVPEMEGCGTLLLVEDEEMVRNMAADMLNCLGYGVFSAKDGVEAVEVFRQHQDEIRCVLCDLTMPRMNGWETLTALRKLAPDIPVILASGYDKAHMMAGDHPEWPHAFLDKPYKLKKLGDTISHALVSKRK